MRRCLGKLRGELRLKMRSGPRWRMRILKSRVAFEVMFDELSKL
jgi:hypothetical protein